MIAIIWFQIIVGIFGALAFAIISFTLYRNEQPIGPWILLSFGTLCLTLARFMVMVGNTLIHDYLITVALIMVFIVSVLKFWDVMELTQPY